ncbi:MAG: FKBP-type peptidyl-prolyl cis-trans isomerase [Deltaproteobacteria bacterium]|nr:FKBP-type peptidyl-prolyl cis-trans isomerase [Deltaproteobacteria bacterium]
MKKFILLAAIGGLVLFPACTKKSEDAPAAGKMEGSSMSGSAMSGSNMSGSASAAAAAAVVTAPNGLKMEDLKVGTGDVAVAGKTVSVHYTGWLTNGSKFDSSVDRGEPFKFPLGGGRVIAGWDQGVAGMKVGGKRKLTIPPDLAYGAGGQGPIPPNSTLVFDVELLGVN